MGSYKEIKGDLLALAKEGKFDYIAHGANCFQTMGAGIALGIKKEFGMAFLADHKDKREPISRLGDFTYHDYSELGLYVVNLYTQFQPGPNLDYIALELCLKKLAVFTSGKRVGLPLIGCGIAGGDWKKVKRLIKKHLSRADVTIVIFDK